MEASAGQSALAAYMADEGPIFVRIETGPKPLRIDQVDMKCDGEASRCKRAGM
jgi:hypothetical protein